MNITNDEIMRYLKTTDTAPGGRTSLLVEEIVCLFKKNITPKSVYGIYDCIVDSSSVTIDRMTITSASLAKHLIDCSRAVLLAATLGANTDTLIRKYSIQDMEKTLIAQSVSTAMIEAYIDEIENDLLQLNELNGFFKVTRFSPGYGDFDITYQKDILKLLDTSRIGLSLTDGLMLIPSKSITAVIGFSQEQNQAPLKCSASERCAPKRCTSCADTNCVFREAAQ